MRICLHIGPAAAGAERIQRTMDAQRDTLAKAGVLVPRSLGARNHTRLFMAVTDPDHVDLLRHSRGHGAPEAQARLRTEVVTDLEREIDRARPDILLLSASQLATNLHRTGEVERLRDLLGRFSDDIDIIAHVDEPARHLARFHAQQVLDGRAAPLDVELGLTGKSDWWDASLATRSCPAPAPGWFEDIQGAPFWLDTSRLIAHWEGVFGADRMRLRPGRPDRLDGVACLAELAAMTGTAPMAGPVRLPDPDAEPSAAWLSRARFINTLFLHLLARGNHRLPRKLWRSLLGELAVPGPAIDAGALAPVSAHFAAANATLTRRFPDLGDTLLTPAEPRDLWQEADPQFGFRATQYLAAFMERIETAPREERAQASDKRPPPEALPPKALETLKKLQASPYAPHNRTGSSNDTATHPAYPPRDPGAPPTGTVVVVCMKDEAPYIVEWVAYHRAIGVDNFLIYTNDCSDGTDAILARLQEMGHVQHRTNDSWKGKSPQQHALNQSLREPVIRDAKWIAHIDVDEFINIRCGTGTLDDLYARIPDATNVAMTWRLFGHGGVHTLDERFVIDQFDHCAPAYCPKPHTVWGFKSLFRNIGAYDKISCHRPNKLKPKFRNRVKWVNGSGQDMSGEVLDNGWRNSRKSIGYDLVQLNHYALRSAESFLIKRQRGRALHVDRSIGLNYWIRMDWGDARDQTIKRNLPRLRAEYDRLMADPRLRALHAAGRDWHTKKAKALHENPEFEDLYQQALAIRLNDAERAAYAMTLDMES
ncbi:MAG: glycosyltransferase family 2 protein [Marinibacterium sp.]